MSMIKTPYTVKNNTHSFFKKGCVILLMICVIGVVIAPTQTTNAYLFFGGAKEFTGDEGFSKIIFTMTYPDTSSVQTTLLRDDFSGGLSIPINTYMVTIIIYSNVSASRYSATPTANTWYSLILTSPTSVIQYQTEFKVDNAYAYFDNGTYIGAGYQATADYYMVGKTFTIQKTITVGTWILDISLYLL